MTPIPRNGSGTYSLPGGTTAVSGQPIASAPYNAMTADVASALTDSLARDGLGGMLAPLAMGGFGITNAGAIAGKLFTPNVSGLVDGATPALDASQGQIFLLTSTQNPTIAVPTNPTSGQWIIIAFTASGGARTLSLNTGAGGFHFTTDIAALSQTVSGKTDYIGCLYNLANTRWDVLAYNKGA